jgi:signal transduction histidine kinase
VTLETRDRETAMDKILTTVETEYRKQSERIRTREEERRNALIDIVRFLDGARNERAATTLEDRLLQAVNQHLDTAIRESLPGSKNFELWIVGAGGPKRVRMGDPEDAPAARRPELQVQRVLDAPEPIYERSPVSLARPEQPDDTHVGLPLRLGSRLVGALLLDIDSHRNVQAEDKRYLELIASQLAVTILTAQLAREAEDRTSALAREQLARHVLHRAGNAASNVSANVLALRSILRDSRVRFDEDLDLDAESTLADMEVDAQILQQTMQSLRTDAIDSQEFNLAEDVRMIADALSREYAVSVDVGGAQYARVRGVRALLRSALDNVVRNAAQEIAQIEPRNGKIVITIRLVADSRTVTVDILDSGRGVAPSQVEGIWDSGTYFREGGHGFGLPISRQVLEDAGGGLALIEGSGAFGGAHFRAWLPTVEGPEE